MSEWKKRRLPEFCTMRYGENLPTSVLTQSGYAVYGANGIIGYVDRWNVDLPTVLVSCRGEYSGKINKTEGRAFVTNNSIPLRIAVADVSTDFLFYTLSLIPPSRIVSGSAQPQVTINDLAKISVDLPPFPQQRKIARILTTLDNVIAQTEALIAKYQAIKQGLMHDLFTRGVDATGKLRPPQSEAPELYKQSDLGWIPKEWDTCIGAELADLITKGESPTWQGFSYQDDGVVFVTSENVREGYIDVSSPKFVSDAFDSKLYRSRLAPGDVLINLVGASIGRSCRVPQDFRRANINQAVCLFRAKNGCWSEWISYYFQLPQVMTRLTSEQVETARANVSLTDIREFVFPVPDDAEIQRVIEVLSANDRLVGATESSLVALRKKKTGLMQDLLTGKVPVKADEPEEITS